MAKDQARASKQNRSLHSTPDSRPDQSGHRKTDTCCSITLPAAISPTGRRVYIQEESLAHLAAQSEELALLIYGFLGRVAVIRALYHHVKMDILELDTGDMPRDRAEKIINTLEDTWSPPLSSALRKIGYRPVSRPYRADFHAILSDDERIAATCHFSNYYTFATGITAAEKMYADTNDIATIKGLIKTTSLYSDFTLISGHSLALIDPAIGTGELKSSHYAGVMGRKKVLKSPSLQKIRVEVFRRTRNDLDDFLSDTISSPSSKERIILDAVRRSVAGAFSVGILKIPGSAHISA